MFALTRTQLNELLVYIRDELNICDVVPEIDIVLKDQLAVYSQPHKEQELYMLDVTKQIEDLMRTNLDGSPSDVEFSMQMPTLSYMESNSFFLSLMTSVNGILVVNVMLLSFLVIYSLMLSDVDE